MRQGRKLTVGRGGVKGRGFLSVQMLVRFGLLMALAAVVFGLIAPMPTWAANYEIPDPSPDPECPDPTPCPPSDDTEASSACKEHPIRLKTGTVTERVRGISLPGVGVSWSHPRTYNSRLQGVNGGVATAPQGQRWSGGA
ncbi:hypothetical protein LCGC14_1916430, partial [marine sediment metagenome]